MLNKCVMRCVCVCLCECKNRKQFVFTTVGAAVESVIIPSHFSPPALALSGVHATTLYLYI